MALLTCRECTTTFAVGLPACPHCQSADHEETEMPKISVLGGPTNTARTPTVGEPPIKHETPEEVAEWPGTSSSASTPSQPSTPETSAPVPRKRARTTASRSNKARAASSSARGTAGSGPETEGDSDAD